MAVGFGHSLHQPANQAVVGRRKLLRQLQLTVVRHLRIPDQQADLRARVRATILIRYNARGKSSAGGRCRLKACSATNMIEASALSRSKDTISRGSPSSRMRKSLRLRSGIHAPLRSVAVTGTITRSLLDWNGGGLAGSGKGRAARPDTTAGKRYGLAPEPCAKEPTYDGLQLLCSTSNSGANQSGLPVTVPGWRNAENARFTPGRDSIFTSSQSSHAPVSRQRRSTWRHSTS